MINLTEEERQALIADIEHLKKIYPEGSSYHRIATVALAALTAVTANSPVIPDGWIKCSERMPLKAPVEGGYSDVEVLVTDGELVEQLLCSAGNPLTDNGYKPWVAFSKYGAIIPEAITHWMPLPAAPSTSAGDDA